MSTDKTFPDWAQIRCILLSRKLDLEVFHDFVNYFGHTSADNLDTGHLAVSRPRPEGADLKWNLFCDRGDLIESLIRDKNLYCDFVGASPGFSRTFCNTFRKIRGLSYVVEAELEE